MKRCLLWGAGEGFNKRINLIKYHEITSQIKVIGITAKEGLLNFYHGYKFIDSKEIEKDLFDIVIIMAEKNTYNSIYTDVINKGFKDEQIVFCDLLGYPWFNFDNYINLKRSAISIFTNNCWGGITYNLLHLKFNSPFINMYLSEKDYIKILKNPKHYMSKEITFYENGYNSFSQKYFPICICDDIKMYFNHYDSFESAKESWERRKKRINWNNLFIMIYTDNLDTVKEFTQLTYDKKICFTPNKYDHPSVCQIEFKDKLPNTQTWEIVNNLFAKQHLCYYNVLNLLLKGKIEKI